MKLRAIGFRGQGSFITSPGVDQIAAKLVAAGIPTDVYNYGDLVTAYTAAVAAVKTGWAVGLFGFSAGVGGVGWIQQHLGNDIKVCVGIDPSRDCVNYPLHNPLDSLLIHNQNWLSRATGVGAAGEASDGQDLGFKRIIEVDENHLFVDLDPKVQTAVVNEFVKVLKE